MLEVARPSTGEAHSGTIKPSCQSKTTDNHLTKKKIKKKNKPLDLSALRVILSLDDKDFKGLKMTKIKLFHNILLNGDEVNEAGNWGVAKYEMKHIASVSCLDYFNGKEDAEILEEAFEMSNHGVPNQIDDWTTNCWWERIMSTECRSTTSGDMISIEKNGMVAVYNCDSIGWTEVADLPASLMA